MRKLLSVLAAALLSGCASIAGAGSLADVSVINRSTGERLPVYRHGALCTSRAARASATRSNWATAPARASSPSSVDGVNAVTGQTAAADQSGYVLDPWRRAEIAGWRKDLSEVAAFYFTALPDSYAARTERPGNVGAIGVAIYREYVEPPRALLDAPAVAKSEPGRLSAGDAAAGPAAPSAMSAQRNRMARRKSAPATASACTRRPGTPSSAAPAARRAKSSRSITTAGRT